MSKKMIRTANAPRALGPYSQGVKTGGLVFVSGQLPIDPATGELIKGDIKAATRQVLENIKAILEEAGTNISEVVKTSVYLTDFSYFDDLNEIYKEYFVGDCPARTCVQVSSLPLGAVIEIEAIAETWS